MGLTNMAKEPGRSAAPAAPGRADGLAGHGSAPPSGEACREPMIRVLLVDDQELVRAGLCGILREPSASRSRRVRRRRRSPSRRRRHRPDIVLMDVRMRRSVVSLPPVSSMTSGPARRCWH